MNERIKEIYLECYRPYSTFDYDKFVELIVKECIDIVPWMYEEKIKKHFGVE